MVSGQTRFDIDTIVRFLDRFPFSPVGAVVVAATIYRRARHTTALGASFFDYLHINKRLAAFLAFVLAKTLNRALSRYAMNHGWARDRPRYSTGKEVVVITGGSGGIGGDIVKLMMRRTNKIAVIDLGELTYPAGPVRFYKGDVTDEQQMAEIAQRIRKEVPIQSSCTGFQLSMPKIGEPTIVIANAGIANGRTLLNCSAEDFERVWRVNALGAFVFIKEFLPYLVKNNHGHVVTVGSSASYMSIAQLCEYSSSKSAVLAVHETLGVELVHRYNAPKVRTTFVCPSKVRTQLGNGMVDNGNQFFAPTLEQSEVAEAVVAQIDSGLSGHVMQPLHARTLLPAIRFMPDWYRWLIHRAGKTHLTVTDESGEAARANHRLSPEEIGKSAIQRQQQKSGA